MTQPVSADSEPLSILSEAAATAAGRPPAGRRHGDHCQGTMMMAAEARAITVTVTPGRAAELLVTVFIITE